jgi:hypothetical protein
MRNENVRNPHTLPILVRWLCMVIGYQERRHVHNV